MSQKESKVEHIVLFNIDPNIVSEENVSEIKVSILNLKKEVDGIEFVTFGKTFTERHHGLYTHAYVARFRDMSAFETFQKSDAQLKVKDQLHGYFPITYTIEDTDISGDAQPKAEQIEHIVLFPFQADATDEVIQGAKNSILLLKEQLDGIEFATFGKDLTDRQEMKFPYAIVVRLKDMAAFEKYGPSDPHQKVVKEFIAPFITGPPLAMDYVITEDQTM